jgi:hypothetical protein
MMTTSQLRPGRIYSFVYSSDVDMVQKRNGAENPLGSCSVSVRRVVRAQAAGNETYARVQLAKDPTWEPSAERKSWYHVTPENDCIVQHNSNGQKYLRAIPRGVVKEEYFIGTLPANEREVETIRSFKKSAGNEPTFVVFKLDNIINLEDTTEQE